MRISPLSLEKSALVRLDYQATKKRKNRRSGENPKIDVSLSWGEPDEEDRRYFITLTTKVDAWVANDENYSLEVVMAGQFVVAQEFPAEKVLDLVFTNGSGILYGSARETVQLLTAKGPWDSAVNLPLMSFRELPEQVRRHIAKSTQGADSAKAAKPSVKSKRP